MAERRSGLPRGPPYRRAAGCRLLIGLSADTPASASAAGQPPGRHRRAARSEHGRAHRFGRRDRFGWRNRLGWRDRLRWPRFGQERRSWFVAWAALFDRCLSCGADLRELTSPRPWLVGSRHADAGCWRYRPGPTCHPGSRWLAPTAERRGGRLAIGRVARLGASESQGVGDGVKVVTRRPCERERVVAQLEVAAGTTSSRLRCHTRCATSSPSRPAARADLGSEPARSVGGPTPIRRASSRVGMAAGGARLIAGSHAPHERQPDGLAAPVGVRVAEDMLVTVAGAFAVDHRTAAGTGAPAQPGLVPWVAVPAGPGICHG